MDKSGSPRFKNCPNPQAASQIGAPHLGTRRGGPVALLLFVLRGFLVDVALKPKDYLHPVLHMFRFFSHFHVIFYVLRNNVKKKKHMCVLINHAYISWQYTELDRTDAVDAPIFDDLMFTVGTVVGWMLFWLGKKKHFFLLLCGCLCSKSKKRSLPFFRQFPLWPLESSISINAMPVRTLP